MKFVGLISLTLFISFVSYAQLSQDGLLFDGIDDRVIVPFNSAYSVGAGDITIEAIIRADSISGGSFHEYLVTQYSTSGATGFAFELDYNGNPRFTVNGIGYSTSAPNSVRDGLCHHIAVSRKDTILSFYIDGVLLPWNFYSNTVINSANNLCIGSRDFNSSPRTFNGLIKEVRIWNVARTQSQILSFINTVVPASSTGLIGYWRFNNISGQNVTDMSLLGNDGVLGNSSAIELRDPVIGTGCPSCLQTAAVVTSIGPTSFCIGDSVLLSANIGLAFSYQWHKNGVPISGAFSSTYYAKTTGTYTVKLVNSGGCTSFSNAVDVVQLLDNAGGITCDAYYIGSWACLNGGGNYRTLSAAIGSGYTYQWTRNGAILPGKTNYYLYTSTPGVYNCIVAVGNCSRITTNFTLGENPVYILSQGVPTSCSLPVQLTASRQYGNSNTNTIYTWKEWGVPVVTSNSSSFQATHTGLYTCTVTDAVCPDSVTANPEYVSIGQLPSPQIGPGTAQTVSDCSFSLMNLFLQDLSGGLYPNDPTITSIYWMYNNSLLLSGMNKSIWVNKSGYYYASISSSVCLPVSNSLSPKIVLLTKSFFPPQIYHGSLTNCTQVSLSVDSYWLGYQWKRNGLNIPGATNHNYTATQSGSYTCELFNDCGSVITSAKTVTIIGSTQGFISAPNGTVVCSNLSVMLKAPTGPGNSYEWKLNGNSILNANNSSYTTNIPGVYTCLITTTCNTFLSNQITLISGPTVPSTPTSIQGSILVCPGSNNVVYSISPVLGATGYIWTIPALPGINIVSGQGTNSISVNFTTSFDSLSLSVVATNICGSSFPAVKTIYSLLPAKPGAISGLTNGVCSSIQTYSISSVSQATSYSWTIPVGSTIVGGQGTSSLSLSYPLNFGSDSLRVVGINSCGVGSSRAVFIKGRPSTPPTISGAINVCAGQTGLNYTISPVYGATSYNWTKPAGALITNGQGTTQLTMTMGSASGTLKVKSSNSCGVSSNKTLTLNVVCREDEMLVESPITVFPNPSSGVFQLSKPEDSVDPIAVFVYNSTGELIEQFEMVDEMVYEIGLKYSTGLYLMKIHSASGSSYTKLLKL